MISNIYFGEVNNSIKTESFKISISNHIAKSKIEKHSHAKPYFCLSVFGDYTEKSFGEDYITQGEVIYRAAGHEHANSFFDKDGVCLNIEINNQDRLMTQNEFILPAEASKQPGGTDFYKVLYGLKNGVANDLLNIYCFESLTTYLESANNGNLSWITEVKEAINDAPLENISLEKLSIDFGLHPNYIVRKFKEISGLKLSDYLTQTRLRYCIDNLLDSDMKLTEIALRNGFYDQSHFNFNFKKHLSTTPSHFRKIVKG